MHYYIGGVHAGSNNLKMEEIMPLKKGDKPGSKSFGDNIATEERAGKKPNQAIAIAFSEAGEKKKKKKK
jgi:hypothetical protein